MGCKLARIISTRLVLTSIGIDSIIDIKSFVLILMKKYPFAVVIKAKGMTPVPDANLS
jgi:hypothetical protein